MVNPTKKIGMGDIMLSERIEKKCPRMNSKKEEAFSEVSYETGKNCPLLIIWLKKRKSSHDNLKIT